MPVTKPSLQKKILSSLRSEGLSGSSVPKVAKGTAQGIVSFLPTISVETTHVGVAGSGTGTGKIILEITQGFELIKENLSSVQIQGGSSKNVAKGMAKGIGAEMNAQAAVQVAVAGVSNGTGQGKLVGMNPQALFSLLMSGFSSEGLTGPGASKMANGLSKGIVSWFEVAQIKTQDAGAPTTPPSPGAGKGTGKIF